MLKGLNSFRRKNLGWEADIETFAHFNTMIVNGDDLTIAGCPDPWVRILWRLGEGSDRPDPRARRLKYLGKGGPMDSDHARLPRNGAGSGRVGRVEADRYRRVSGC
jgi:hypothetical protein